MYRMTITFQSRLQGVISRNFRQNQSESRKLCQILRKILPMFLAERHERILAELADGGQSVVQLAEALGVSESTIRRDLDILAKSGR